MPLPALRYIFSSRTALSLTISSTLRYRSRWSSGRFTSTSSAGFRSMPVSLLQIVAAFSIMWCMTLKCRTAVPADNRARRQPLRLREALVPALNAGAVNLPDKQVPKLAADSLQNSFLAVLRFFLTGVLLPVLIDQRGHSEIDLPLDIEVAVLIARR